MTDSDDLPLRSRTPDAWATAVLAEPLELLCDHAHLERKAASNALELLTRWPETDPPANWTAALSAVARDEVEHLGVVTRLLYRRGGRLAKQHANPYASALRGMVRRGDRGELLDRLLISGLIELRSCERFEVLGRMSDDAALASLYQELWSSEKGHYLLFLQLGASVASEAEAESRLNEMLDQEAAILERLPPGATMHSGYMQQTQ